MAGNKISSSMDLLPQSFRLIRSHLNAVVWLVYLPALLMGLGQMLVAQVFVSQHYAQGAMTLTRLGNDVLGSPKGQLGLGLAFAGLIWSILVFPAIIYGTLAAAKGKDFDPINAAKESRRYFWKTLGLTAIIAAIVEIGLILFVVPGIIFLRMLILAPYYLVEHNLGVFEAMRVSARQSRLSKGPIYGVIGVLIWLMIGGAFLGIIPVIGVVLSLIVTYLYLFGPALRFIELDQRIPNGDKKPAGHRRKNS